MGRRSKLKSHMLEVQQRVSWKKMKYTVRKLAMHTSVLIVVLGDRREMLKLLSDYSVVIKKAPRLQASRLLQINFANIWINYQLLISCHHRSIEGQLSMVVKKAYPLWNNSVKVAKQWFHVSQQLVAHVSQNWIFNKCMVECILVLNTTCIKYCS